MSITNRVKQLEKNRGANDVYKYICVMGTGWDSPEEAAKGYKVQPFTQTAGGIGGAPFYLATEAELKEFAARPDVDLQRIHINFTEQANKE